MRQHLIVATPLLCGLLMGLLLVGLASVMALPAEAVQIKGYSVADQQYIESQTVDKSDAEWRRLITLEQYQVLREKDTERAYTGAYDKHHELGIYRCAGCGLDLFASADKFYSGAGCPSFTAPVVRENIANEKDFSFAIGHTEILCARYGGHLGDVLDDGPKPTGLRYCINSVALSFIASR